MTTPRFVDKDGREWPVEITVLTVKRLKRHGFNLYNVIDSESREYALLNNDGEALVDFLYVVCQDDCQAREVDEESFARLFNGDSIAAAGEAVQEALAAFFQNPRQRVAMAKLAGNMRLTKLVAEALVAIADKARSTSNDGSTELPDSLESTPAVSA